MADHHSPTEHADHDADAYVHGAMTIEEQSATYSLFMNLAKTLWFQPGGSFIAGLIGGGVLAVAGGFYLKGGKSH
jgi:hypothetical protein